MDMDREGVILKKCDRANHRPTTNKACAAGTCQHTCDTPERCSHAWTLRYSVNDRQRELSFKDDLDSQGRVKYESGKRKAKDAQLKIMHDKRAQGASFVDPRSGREDFCAAVDKWIARHPGTASTRDGYRILTNTWIKPTFTGRSLAQVAVDRDRVTDLLVLDMAHLSGTRRRQARTIITGTIDAAVKSGKLAKHNLHDIDLPDNGTPDSRDDFVFPTYGQIASLADEVGIIIWLMRGCGLRICEAIGTHKEDFRDGGKILRLTGQSSTDGREKLPLKHRKAGEYRDVPVPTWLWEKIKDLPGGPLCPGNDGKRYQHYATIGRRIKDRAEKAGIPAGFRPHSLRHAFASVMLARRVPITDVAKWLGHRDINETYRTYGHLVPNAADRAVAALDAEYAEWSKTG
jgi:integrase